MSLVQFSFFKYGIQTVFSDVSCKETRHQLSHDETKVTSDEFDSEMGLSPIPGPPSPSVWTRTTPDRNENLEPRPDSSRDMFSDEDISFDQDDIVMTTLKDETGHFSSSYLIIDVFHFML